MSKGNCVLCSEETERAFECGHWCCEKCCQTLAAHTVVQSLAGVEVPIGKQRKPFCVACRCEKEEDEEKGFCVKRKGKEDWYLCGEEWESEEEGVEEEERVGKVTAENVEERIEGMDIDYVGAVEKLREMTARRYDAMMERLKVERERALEEIGKARGEMAELEEKTRNALEVLGEEVALAKRNGFERFVGDICGLVGMLEEKKRNLELPTAGTHGLFLIDVGEYTHTTTVSDSCKYYFDYEYFFKCNPATGEVLYCRNNGQGYDDDLSEHVKEEEAENGIHGTRFYTKVRYDQGVGYRSHDFCK